MYRIRKKFTFEMAHQLNHAVTAACYETIHGHSYTVELFLESPTLNADGMVIDFGALASVKGWLTLWFDHALLIPDTFSPEYQNMLGKYNKKVRVTPVNPTAEWMARFILEQAVTLLAPVCKTHPVLVTKVRVHETSTGWAEYEA